MKKKQLKDYLDFSEFLANRCYCPGEIYQPNGFFFQLFKDTDEVYEICQNDEVLVLAECKEKRPQIIFVWKDKEKVADAQIIDVTENNILLCKELVEKGKTERKADEFVKGQTQKSLQEIMSLSNGLIIRD